MLSCLALLLGACPGLAQTESAGEAGFEPLFDGRTLQGWSTPDTSWWSVEDGAITGRITPEKPCAINQYLVWAGGDLANFELKLRSRLSGEGAINNGFQFRSRVLPDHDVCGYQMDNNLQTPWLVRLYDEYGRHTLAWRGEKAVFNETGARHVEPLAEGAGEAWFSLGEWHEYHLICDGPRLALRVNGRLTAEALDHDPRRFESAGALALQLHSGPPTVVQFKDIRVKRLPDSPSSPSTKTGGSQPAAAPDILTEQQRAVAKDALAWWDLGTGGHGTRPPLRHLPAFEHFELNVRPAGPGRVENSKIILLDGAHFEAGPDLPGETAALTVHLRFRDAAGAWDSTLISKSDAEGRTPFRLFSTDRPSTEGPDLVFEITTSQGTAAASAPVSSWPASAWHEVTACYDGHTLALFRNGQLVAERPCTGTLPATRDPLLIGAEKNGEATARHFRGEMQTAALWARALSREEIRQLAHGSSR